MGAAVIKIEQPGVGDPARLWGPPIADGTSVIFQVANRGKEPLELDLTKRDDLARLKRIVNEQADVFIQNLRPGAVETLGLDATTLMTELRVLSIAIWAPTAIPGPGQTALDTTRWSRPSAACQP